MANTLSGPGGQHRLIQLTLALVLLGALVWLLPVRHPGEDGGHHAAHDRALDLFERAGVSELAGGQRAPEFHLQRFSGGRGSLADYAGTLIILNFWATWCTPCTLEMPTLEALWQQYRERRLVVIGISVDVEAPRHLIAPYLSNLGLTFPVLLDPDMRTAQAWRVTALPATFIIAPGGNLVGLAIGPREWDGAPMRALVESLLPAAGLRP
ncbi:MAG: TlpA family protein disulfide reductase [Candidatus Rokuibacteriota bacterium]